MRCAKLRETLGLMPPENKTALNHQRISTSPMQQSAYPLFQTPQLSMLLKKDLHLPAMHKQHTPRDIHRLQPPQIASEPPCHPSKIRSVKFSKLLTLLTTTCQRGISHSLAPKRCDIGVAYVLEVPGNIHGLVVAENDFDLGKMLIRLG